MAEGQKSGNLPFTHVEGNDEESPLSIGGDPLLPNYPMFRGVEIADATQAHVYDTKMGMFDGVSGKPESLLLHDDMLAENPMSYSQQVSVQPDVDNMDAENENNSAPVLLVGLEEHGQPQASTANMTAGESLSAAAATAKVRLLRASNTMKEGVKQASVGVAYAGDKVGKAWNKTLESAMWVCVVCGGLAIILLLIAASLRCWRYQELTYNDGNGINTSRVELGLVKLQRIQSLERTDDSGDVYIYDEPLSYTDAMSSAYCVPVQPPEEEPLEVPPSATPTDSLPTGMGSEAAGEIASASPIGFSSRYLLASLPSVRAGPLAVPPTYSITVGRNPGAPGGLEDRYKEMRQILLGATVYDVHCQDLGKFKDSGSLFIRMAIAYLVFAAVGMLAAILSLALASRMEPWCMYMKRMPINLLGTTAWVVALVLQLSGLAVWGVGTDVAACVTSEGGAAVCNLGAAAALTIASMVFTLVAATSYCVFFVHKFIRDLGLEKEREQKLREASERHQAVELEHQEEGFPEVQCHTFGPGAPQTGGALQLGPHPPVEGESNSPMRSITEESHSSKQAARQKTPPP